MHVHMACISIVIVQQQLIFIVPADVPGRIQYLNLAHCRPWLLANASVLHAEEHTRLHVKGASD